MKRLISLLAAGWMLLPGSVYGQYDGHAVEQLQKFAQAYRYLSAVYVDSLDTAPLAEEAIRAMLERLDPHSAYLSAEEMRGVDESFDGRFSGIGIEFNILNDTMMVVNTIAGGPSAAVGLLPAAPIHNLAYSPPSCQGNYGASRCKPKAARRERSSSRGSAPRPGGPRAKSC